MLDRVDNPPWKQYADENSNSTFNEFLGRSGLWAIEAQLFYYL